MGQESLSMIIQKLLITAIYITYLIFFRVQEFLRQKYRKHFDEKKRKGQVWVSGILLKHKMVHEIARREDFLPGAGKWENLEVLDNPCWHLYCIEKDRVFFVLLPHPITEFGASAFPFMTDPIYEAALSLAEVEMEEFFQLSLLFSKRPQPKTVLFTNGARAGTTLMAKMLDRKGYSVCLGEPHALCNISIFLMRGLLSTEELIEMMTAAVICLRAHIPVDQIFILKTTSLDACLVPLCREIPSMKHIFMYRKKGLPSMEKIWIMDEFMNNLLLRVLHISPALCGFISGWSVSGGEFIRKMRPQNMREYSALGHAAPFMFYMENKEKYSHPIIWYHDVLKETRRTLSELFSEIGISSECVDEAVGCKDADSQENSPLSQENLSWIKIPPYTEKDKILFKRLAKQLNVPEEIFEC